MGYTHSRWLCALASAGSALVVACGSNQTVPTAGPPPPNEQAAPTTGPSPTTGSPAWGAVHVHLDATFNSPGSISPGSISSYAISPETGRLTLAGTVGDLPPGQMAADPEGRFLIQGNEASLYSFAVDGTGRLELRAQLSVPQNPIYPSQSCKGLDTELELLTATRAHVYLVTRCDGPGSQTRFAVQVFAVAADLSLTLRGAVNMGNDHRDGGEALFVEPGGRIAFRQKRYPFLLAQEVHPDGMLGAVTDELEMPDWDDFGRMHWVQGFLIVTDQASRQVASIAVGQGGDLELRSLLAMVDWQSHLFVHPFRSAGLLIGRFQGGYFAPSRRIFDVTLYEVRPNGQLRALHQVPDPQYFYSVIRQEPRFGNSRLIRFHPSWRFAYAVSDVERVRSLRTFAVAADGELSLIEQFPQPATQIALTPPVP